MMNPMEIRRKDLDNSQFMQLRQTTETIAGVLDKRLKAHLKVLRPLFLPRKLLGAHMKSAVMEETPGSDKAFAELREMYAAVCEKPFGLPKKLHPPLPNISNRLQAAPLVYTLFLDDSREKSVEVTSPTRWVLSYQCDASFSRLKAMAAGVEPGQPDDMRQALINHLAMVLFLRRFPELTRLLRDLRHEVDIVEQPDLGGLPVVLLTSPIRMFLPPDDFITQITQLSGVAAFREIVDPDALDAMPDPLRDALEETTGTR